MGQEKAPGEAEAVPAVASRLADAAALSWARAHAAAEELGLKELIQKRFWLLSGLMLAAAGMLPLLWAICKSNPCLLFWGLTTTCLLVHVGAAVERHGLVAFVPGTEKIFRRPLFDLLRLIVAKVTIYACNILRVGMLVCVELTEEQSREVLEGLDPTLRRDVFQRPLVQLLPFPLQRLLLGRDWLGQQPPVHVYMPPPEQTGGQEEQHPEVVGEGIAESEGDFIEAMPGGACTPKSFCRKSSADSLLELVRGLDGVVETTRAQGTVNLMERILSQKVAGSVVNSARAAVSSAKQSAAETLTYGKTKVSEIGEGVREVAADRKAQATAVSAVGGAVALGASGGTTGLVSGSLLGAAAGVVPAFFTFGLSIPVCAALGGGAGLCVGTTMGSTAGFFGGGVAGYTLYSRHEAEGENEEEQPALQPH